jgi:23S rRNA (cytidine1920-2'-O)/16S rRNA (cytidine1409-2'-O)-methyltransferase
MPPALLPLLKGGGKIITLIKPQFELKKGEVGAGGIVREAEKHRAAIGRVNGAAAENNLSVSGLIESPITGAQGNKEFLALYEKRDDG